MHHWYFLSCAGNTGGDDHHQPKPYPLPPPLPIDAQCIMSAVGQLSLPHAPSPWCMWVTYARRRHRWWVPSSFNKWIMSTISVTHVTQIDDAQVSLVSDPIGGDNWTWKSVVVKNNLIPPYADVILIIPIGTREGEDLLTSWHGHLKRPGFML